MGNRSGVDGGISAPVFAVGDEVVAIDRGLSWTAHGDGYDLLFQKLAEGSLGRADAVACKLGDRLSGVEELSGPEAGDGSDDVIDGFGGVIEFGEFSAGNEVDVGFSEYHVVSFLVDIGWRSVVG